MNSKWFQLTFRCGALFSLLTCTALADSQVTNLTASASSTYLNSTTYAASNAVDGDVNTIWSSGAFPIGQIVVDTGAQRTLTRITLLTSQYPDGRTSHDVYTSPDASSWSYMGSLSGYTTDNQSLAISFGSGTPGRYIAVNTMQSPSWVGWREIQVFEQAATLPPPQATFLGQTTVGPLTAGQTVTMNVTMQNTGGETWTSAAQYTLGSSNPWDNLTWGIGRVALPGPIAPGQSATFSFPITAPTTSQTQTYNLQWQMLQEGVVWFGDTTPNQLVTVSPQQSGGCSSITATLGLPGFNVESQVPWSGCGQNGTGIQAALNSISTAGSGTLQLAGTGVLLVQQPLVVSSHTTISGNSAIGQYGTHVVGDSLNSACIPGGTYRHWDCAVFTVAGQNSVAFNYLDFVGDNAGRILDGPVIQLNAVNTAAISSVRVVGARKFAFQVVRSSNVTISGAYIEMRTGGTDSDGGSGVWVPGSTNVTLQNSTLTAPQYYNAGWPTPSNTMDLVAFYGGSGNRVQHNVINYGNTAAVYFATCMDPTGIFCTYGAGESTPLIWDNTMDHFQQHGIDIEGCSQPSVLTNQISNTGTAGVSIAGCSAGVIQYNSISATWQSALWSAFSIQGALWVYDGATGNNVTANAIDASNGSSGHAQYAVAIGSMELDAGPRGRTTKGNTITGNDLWPPTTGGQYFGAIGNVTDNTITPNYLHGTGGLEISLNPSNPRR